jgi:hypothetical protein
MATEAIFRFGMGSAVFRRLKAHEVGSLLDIVIIVRVVGGFVGQATF